MSKAKYIDPKVVRERFEYKDGELYWKSHKRRPNMVGTKVKVFDNGQGYHIIDMQQDGGKFRSHRVIWTLFNGEIPEGMLVDHINTNRKDNRIENLRLATMSENQHNSKVRKNNSVGLKGVILSSSGKKYTAKITVSGEHTHIGTFDCKYEAHEAYCKVSKELIGEFFNDGNTDGKT